MKSKPKILITGGLGNLGSWILAHFSKLDYEIHVLSKSKRSLIEGYKFKLILCDVSNVFEVELKLKKSKYDYVVHLASYNNVGASNYGKDALLTNALGTKNLLDIVKDTGVKHFIYLSTFQVYGKYQGIIDENEDPKPINDYGMTHYFAEKYVEMYGETCNIPFSILRPTNGYGAPKDINSSKWNLILNDLSQNAFLNKEIKLNTNGQALRDYVWLGTICDAIEQLLHIPAQNTVYNVSGEKCYSTYDIAKVVQKVYMEEFGEELPIALNDKDKSEYSDSLVVKSSKLRETIDVSDENKMQQEVKEIFRILKK